jgi:hypothetical protein
MINVGILYICTGKYSVFFEQFYESAEKYFIKNQNKTYYVFTDDVNIKERHNVKVINQPVLGWPYDTMKRFHMFNSIKDTLLNENYLFFFNANMKFVDYVNEEILPNEENDNLMAVNHPGFYNSPKGNFTYERRPQSRFYIPYNEGTIYYQGCLNGGKSDVFLDMTEKLAGMIDEDLSNDIIPVWWDESALNWYYKDKNPLAVSPSYAYPEGWNLPFEKKIIQLDKNKFGGYNFLRNL